MGTSPPRRATRRRGRTRRPGRWTLRLVVASALALGLGYLPYEAYGPGGLSRALRLEQDLSRLEESNRDLRRKNQALRGQIEALKSDDDAVERVARDELGLVRAGDVVFLFE